MGELISLERALCLPAPDITALLKGQNIVAIPKVAVQRGWTFALYPCDLLNDSLPVQQQYHSYAHTSAQAALAELNTSVVKIETWARCELSTMIHDAEQLEVLSCSTVWTKAALQKALNQRQHVFLAYLQVYRLAEPISVSANFVTSDKCGKFVSLSSISLESNSLTSIKLTEPLPILEEAIFIQRKQRLEIGKKPFHSELHEIYNELNKLEKTFDLPTKTSKATKKINQEVRSLLGWCKPQKTEPLQNQQEFLQKIVLLGNRSIEEEEGKKSNYQAGTDFELIVRQALFNLGFSVSEEHKGGAGGIDLYCSKPYSMVVECKCGKSIPGNTVYELDNLADDYFEDSQVEVRMIIGPGKPTDQLQKRAERKNISIISPMTLQKLVELEAKHHNSIDLIELKEYLKPGQSDSKIEEFIAKILREIQLRANVVEAVKQLSWMEPERRQFEVSEVRVQYNVLFSQKDGTILDNATVHELLIELSSPLVGCLGRLRGTSLQSDRFYYLRDLTVE